MDDEKYITMMCALADVQIALDSLGVDIERVMDELGIVPRSALVRAARYNPAPAEPEIDVPVWVHRPKGDA